MTGREGGTGLDPALSWGYAPAMERRRQPGGSGRGGQFAPGSRPEEAAVDLDACGDGHESWPIAQVDPSLSAQEPQLWVLKCVRCSRTYTAIMANEESPPAMQRSGSDRSGHPGPNEEQEAADGLGPAPASAVLEEMAKGGLLIPQRAWKHPTEYLEDCNKVTQRLDLLDSQERVMQGMPPGITRERAVRASTKAMKRTLRDVSRVEGKWSSRRWRRLSAQMFRR